MIVESIMFDLDGTLVDSAPGIEYALREAVAAVAADRRLVIPDLRCLLGLPIHDMLKRALPDMNDTMLNELEHQFRQSYDSIGWRGCAAYDGVLEMLSCLPSDIRCFVVTNKRNIPAIRILKRLGILSLFGEVVSWDSTTPPFASKSEMSSYVMRKHSLHPSATILVGDSSDDARAAQSCGIGFVAVAYGYGDAYIRDDFQKYFILDKFADLLPIINKKESRLVKEQRRSE